MLHSKSAKMESFLVFSILRQMIRFTCYAKSLTMFNEIKKKEKYFR